MIYATYGVGWTLVFDKPRLILAQLRDLADKEGYLNRSGVNLELMEPSTIDAPRQVIRGVEEESYVRQFVTADDGRRLQQLLRTRAEVRTWRPGFAPPDIRAKLGVDDGEEPQFIYVISIDGRMYAFASPNDEVGTVEEEIEDSGRLVVRALRMTTGRFVNLDVTADRVWWVADE